MSTLKPCPFCGGSPKISKSGLSVDCKCGCRLYIANRAQATDWNSRAHIERDVSETKALSAFLNKANVRDAVFTEQEFAMIEACLSRAQADGQGVEEEKHPCACVFQDEECIDICCYHQDLEKNYKMACEKINSMAIELGRLHNEKLGYKNCTQCGVLARCENIADSGYFLCPSCCLEQSVEQ